MNMKENSGKSLKRLGALTLAFALCMSLLSGCGQTGGTSGSGAGSSTQGGTSQGDGSGSGSEVVADSQSHYTDPIYEPDFTTVDENGDTIYDNRGAVGENGAVATGSIYTSRIGMEILQAGGNAIDAAVAISFGLGVVMPQMTGIGGGGYMLIHTADGESVFLDGQVVAPELMTPDMWVKDSEGTIVGDQQSFGGKAVGTPTLVATLSTALEDYGTMSLEEVMEPAIRLAEEGFAFEPSLENDTNASLGWLGTYGDYGAELYLENGFSVTAGSHFENPDLAETYKKIAEGGKEAFYTGELAETIVSEVQKYGGVMTMEDMANVMESQPVKRTPVEGDYRGYKVLSAAPSSSGGTMVIEQLNILENFDVGSMDIRSPEYINLMMETSKLIFADRAAYMGDPAFVDLPVDGLITDEYGAERAALIELGTTQDYEAGDPWKYTPDDSIWLSGNREEGDYYNGNESRDTTHFSVADADGNVVSMTQTLRGFYGSAVFPEGTGFVLNNCMADFTFGSDSPNSVEGGKKPLSSMSPTLVLNADGTPFMVTGTPGSIAIFQNTAHSISLAIDHGLNPQEICYVPNYIWNNGTEVASIAMNLIGGEDYVPDETIEALTEMGYEVFEENVIWSRFEIIQYMDDGTIFAYGDPRNDSKALAY